MGWLIEGRHGAESPAERAENSRQAKLAKQKRLAEFEQAQKDDTAKFAASLAELRANPPTEAEFEEWVKMKQKEALTFIDEDDPEFPQPEDILKNLFHSLAVEEFLKKFRR